MGKKLLIAGLIVFLYFKMTKPIEWPEIAPLETPTQTELKAPKSFHLDEFSLKALANFKAKALVLSASRYRFDDMAKFCPLDLALAWGPMTSKKVLEALKIKQIGRFYEFQYQHPAPLPNSEIIANSSNIHMIPANESVRETLFSVKQGEIIEFTGLLVEVTAPTGRKWTSSVSRTDTDGGACEIVWVESVSITH